MLIDFQTYIYTDVHIFFNILFYYYLFQQGQFDEIGGINLDVVSWYILAIACGSYVRNQTLTN